MNDVVLIAAICFVAAVLGAALGVAWTGRRRGASSASPVDLAPLATRIATDVQARLDARWNARFEAQHLAQAAAQQQAALSLHQALQAVPSLLQRALQIELEFQATQQAQRDQAQRQQHERWQGELQGRVDGLLQALRPQPALASVRAAPAPQREPYPTLRAPVSARPPEWGLTPIARPEPVYAPQQPVPELTDEEIDALAPELPLAGPPRKRVLPAPTQPPPWRAV